MNIIQKHTEHCLGLLELQNIKKYIINVIKYNKLYIIQWNHKTQWIEINELNSMNIIHRLNEILSIECNKKQNYKYSVQSSNMNRILHSLTYTWRGKITQEYLNIMHRIYKICAAELMFGLVELKFRYWNRIYDA